MPQVLVPPVLMESIKFHLFQNNLSSHVAHPADDQNEVNVTCWLTDPRYLNMRGMGL